MNPVFDTLIENLRQINIICQETPKSFKGDRKQTGDKREITIQDFIKQYFPPSFVVKKGKIFSNDFTSNEIDSVILTPNHPMLKTPMREIIIAEGVYAAIEIKPDISTLTENSEFERGLKQIKSVRQITRKYQGTNDSNFIKIPSILFSIKSNKKPIEVVKFMKLVQLKNGWTQDLLPNLIVTLDNGVFHWLEKGSRITEILKSFYNIKENDEIIHYKTKSVDTLVVFLSYLMAQILHPEFDLRNNHLFNYLTPSPEWEISIETFTINMTDEELQNMTDEELQIIIKAHKK
ncbi:MAG: hypothetical protein KAT68_00850 [Bacteroidales bacterium]|nr:hypothetical protein [Bacteroidales bacterium]